MLEEEQRGKDEAREALSRAERRVSEMNSELDETRTALEQVNSYRASCPPVCDLCICF